MKKIIYLIQGEAKLVQNFFELKDRSEADVLFLTYDEQIDEAIYLPKSTWAQGRNLLLEKALELPQDYEYYIFLDDDVRFIKGNFDLFERKLLKYRPAIAVPVFRPKTVDSILGIGISSNGKLFVPITDHQLCKYTDGQFMAFHKDVVHDSLIVPLQTQFDDISWWFTSSTQQILMLNLYKDEILQFNDIVIDNEAHREYTKGQFKAQQREWLRKQLVKPMKLRLMAEVNFLSLRAIAIAIRDKTVSDGFRQFLSILAGTVSYKAKGGYHISEDQISTLLKPDSELMSQYCKFKEMVSSR